MKQAQVEIDASKLERRSGLIQQKLILEGSDESYVFIHRRWVPGDSAFEESSKLAAQTV